MRRAVRAFRTRSRRRSSSLPFDDRDGTRAALEPHLDDLAAVIVEPVLGAGGVLPAATGSSRSSASSRATRARCSIFDEVISFRIGYHGAQGRFGVTPDLTTLGKIIGGGLPVGAFGGRADVMALFDPRRRRPHRPRRDVQRQPADDGGRAGDARPSSTPDRFDALEALAGELEAGVNARTAATAAAVGSLFRIELPDRSHLPDLHLGLLANGILMTPRGMGCLSTPMTSAEIGAFVDAVQAVV